jgi:hypothetical protein
MFDAWQQNRPYSVLQLFDNLHATIPRTRMQQMLDRFTAEGLIQCKVFGKSQIYFANQGDEAVPQDELDEMDERVEALKKELAEARAANKIIQSGMCFFTFFLRVHCFLHFRPYCFVCVASTVRRPLQKSMRSRPSRQTQTPTPKSCASRPKSPRSAKSSMSSARAVSRSTRPIWRRCITNTSSFWCASSCLSKLHASSFPFIFSSAHIDLSTISETVEAAQTCDHGLRGTGAGRLKEEAVAVYGARKSPLSALNHDSGIFIAPVSLLLASQNEQGIETDEEHKVNVAEFQTYFDTEIAPRLAKMPAPVIAKKK